MPLMAQSLQLPAVAGAGLTASTSTNLEGSNPGLKVIKSRLEAKG